MRCLAFLTFALTALCFIKAAASHRPLRRSGRVLHFNSSAPSVHHVRSISTDLFNKCSLNLQSSDKASRPFLVPRTDQWVGPSICSHGEWDAPGVRECLQYIRPGTIVVDAGANLGSFTVPFANKAGTVIAFEPQFVVFGALTANVLLSGFKNIQIYRAALGHRHGMVAMHNTQYDGTAGPDGTESWDDAVEKAKRINFGGRGLGRGGERVPMITLDSLQLDNVSFIKADLQGSERLFLWGAKETVQRCRPALHFEESPSLQAGVFSADNQKSMQIPPEVVSWDVHAWIKALGYKVVSHAGEDWTYAPN